MKAIVTLVPVLLVEDVDITYYLNGECDLSEMKASVLSSTIGGSTEVEDKFV